jgi:hypothetical protein
MKYCPECGKKLLKANLKYCPECGAALSKETPPPVSAEQPPAAAVSAKAGTEKLVAEEPTARSRKPRFRPLRFVLGMLLLFGILLLVLYFSGGLHIGATCANVTCSDHCNGNIRYYNGFCVIGQCEYYPEVCQNGCSNGSCNSPKANLSQIYISTSYENKEPYYSTYCDRINPYDLSVREAASEAIRKHPGAYSVNQLFDIYDWVKANIEYQNVPLGGIPYPASETLATKSGDCKNQAVLIVSMIRAIGGTAKVVVDVAPECKHAYAIVYFGSSETDLSNFARAVTNHYGSNAKVNYLTYDNGIWVIFDPAGGHYPGNTLKNCTGNRTVNMITSCLVCVNQYPNMPYTFNDKCYSQCPSGTIKGNEYACKPCPEGYQSYNNQCLKCPTGQILGTDGLCYQTCGSSTTYCQSGSYCYNNKCVTCQAGYILGTDGLCHQPCGSPTTYCPSGDYCSNGLCYR